MEWLPEVDFDGASREGGTRADAWLVASNIRASAAATRAGIYAPMTPS
jgi:hypothetical protein